MSKTATATGSLIMQGDGFQQAPWQQVLTNVTSPISVVHAALTAGNNPQTSPNDANNPCRGAFIFSPTTSTNVKTLKGVAGDTGIGAAGVGWTSQWAFIPMGNNQAWAINSVGSETVDIFYV